MIGSSSATRTVLPWNAELNSALDRAAMDKASRSRKPGTVKC
jgi:hypothetical protein